MPASTEGRRLAGFSSGTAYTLAAALGFGAVSTLTTLAVNAGASVPTVLTWRYVLSSVVLATWVGIRGYPRMPAREMIKFLAIGGGGQAIFVGLALSSITYIPIATLAFLFYTYPAWVTIVQSLRGQEPLRLRRAGALVLSFAGIVVMVGVPSTRGTPAATAPYWTGVGLALAAAVIYGVYIPVMRDLQKDHPVPVTSALAKIGSAACFLVWATANHTFEYSLTAPAWQAIAALTIFSTVLPSVFFLMGLIRLGAVRTAIVSTVEPFITALFGAAVLGQELTLRTVEGGAIIVAAVVLLQFRRERVA